MTDYQAILKQAVALAEENTEGSVANYIPELANVEPDIINIAVTLNNGEQYLAGTHTEQCFTLQSVSKLIILIGMLEEMGPKKVYSWVRTEPSGDDFASIARLDQFGPVPSNPMLNAGAIALCSRIPGDHDAQLGWIANWTHQLFGEALSINHGVFESEERTGARNRSLAYLLKSNSMLAGDVEQTLETYFKLCSFEANVKQASYLPMLLARGGTDPNGKQIMSRTTVEQVASIMATCGLYNESGTHLVRTGMPAKSGVSGLVIATALHKAGVAVASPRINRKGTSIRGEAMLEYLSQQCDWHFFG